MLDRLDHFEGRSYTGRHRHVTLTALAQAGSPAPEEAAQAEGDDCALT
jgi:hypothetical protein